MSETRGSTSSGHVTKKIIIYRRIMRRQYRLSLPVVSISALLPLAFPPPTAELTFYGLRRRRPAGRMPARRLRLALPSSRVPVACFRYAFKTYNILSDRKRTDTMHGRTLYASRTTSSH